MARICIKNSLFYGSDKFSSLIVPWCTFTEPEVAHVGLYPADLDAKGIAYDTLRKDFDDNDRNRTEGETTGFVKIHVQRGKDVILGATIVGEAAGDMISEITVAMSNGMGVSALVSGREGERENSIPDNFFFFIICVAPAAATCFIYDLNSLLFFLL